jgi:Domain of unknown function (DUF4388)
MSKPTEFLLLFFQNGVFVDSSPVPEGLTPLRRLLEHFSDAARNVETGVLQVTHRNERPELSFVAPREGSPWTLGLSPIPPGTGVTLEDGHRVGSPTGLFFVVVRRPGVQGVIRGRLEQLALDGLLGLLGEGRKTGRVCVRSSGEGSVWLEDGLVVGADWAPTGETGEGALGRIVILTTGAFELIEMTPPEDVRTIGPIGSNTDLLLRVCQAVDENGKAIAPASNTRKPAKGLLGAFGINLG